MNLVAAPYFPDIYNSHYFSFVVSVRGQRTVCPVNVLQASGLV
jgi:hypothetical protein